MDLTASLLRMAAVRPHVLPAVMPGGTAVRLALEREMRVRGLPLALTPADADVLLVAGPGNEVLRGAVHRIAQDMPAPRVVTHAAYPEQVHPALVAAYRNLSDVSAQRAKARPTDSRTDEQATEDEGSTGADNRREAGGENGSRPGGDTDDQHGRPGHAGQGGHGQHDHGGHGGGHDGAAMPAGLPMADVGEDRDGLTLDRLHLALGPVLTDWPAGLTVRTTLQGDVIQHAEPDASACHGARVRPGFWTEPWEKAAAGERVSAGSAARRRAASRLDSLGRLLAVAGWPTAATTARRLRDDLLDGATAATVRRRGERLARRVGRSRTLYWLTRGMGVVSAQDAEEVGLSGPAAQVGGDVPARYRSWLATVLDDFGRLDDATPLDPTVEESPRGRWDERRSPSAALVEVLPRLLQGAELAAARLIVASLDPDPEELAARPGESAHD